MTRLPIGLFVLLGTFGVGGVRQVVAQEPAPAPAPGEPAAPDASGTPSNEAIGAAAAGPAAGTTGPARPKWDDIVVVPRKAFLKSGRLELSPFSGVSVNDVLIRHYAFGGDLNYYLTDVFSVGLQGQYFIKERTDRESVTGLQFNRVPTLNKFKWGAALNFGYVPGYGKFTLFNRYIFHWDIFASAGVGIVRTEIIPRIVGDETFVNNNIAPNFGIGSRLFLLDWLTFSVTFRDYVFNDKYEPTSRMPGDAIATVKSNASSQFVNAMMLYASVGFYLPMSFDYKTPR